MASWQVGFNTSANAVSATTTLTTNDPGSYRQEVTVQLSAYPWEQTLSDVHNYVQGDPYPRVFLFSGTVLSITDGPNPLPCW